MSRIHRIMFAGEQWVDARELYEEGVDFESLAKPIEYGLFVDISELDASSSVAPIGTIVQWCQEGSNALAHYERTHGLGPGMHKFSHVVIDVEEEEE